MHSRLKLLAVGGLLLAALQTPRAETRSSTMQVRVTVVRACSVDTRFPGGEGTVAVTCSQGAGVMASGSGAVSRVVPIPARQATVVSTRPSFTSGTVPAAGAESEVALQIVTVNF